ncbi:MAG: condensation domain-containing protein, partial [Acidobacteriota bacterium]|nr:condensation domain-containing protein [Acidobacteriota bacterium]
MSSASFPGAAPASASVRKSDVVLFPCSFAQERLWFLDQLDPSSPLYNIFASLRLEGDLDQKAFAASVQEIVRRHEILRTTFAMSEGRPVQVVANELKITVPVIDLTNLPQADRDSEARRRAIEESQRPYEVEKGPLLRVQLLRLAEQEHV